MSCDDNNGTFGVPPNNFTSGVPPEEDQGDDRLPSIRHNGRNTVEEAFKVDDGVINKWCEVFITPKERMKRELDSYMNNIKDDMNNCKGETYIVSYKNDKRFVKYAYEILIHLGFEPLGEIKKCSRMFTSPKGVTYTYYVYMVEFKLK
jgi:hypothetical protein